FAATWAKLASRLGLEVVSIPTDWRRGADTDAIAARLAEDREGRVKDVCIVHNETSTGSVSRIDRVRAAHHAASHPALLIDDTISSLGSLDYRMDEWGVDVTVAGSQKGLMLPPGLGFNAVSEKALAVARTVRCGSTFWSWQDILAANEAGSFP